MHKTGNTNCKFCYVNKYLYFYNVIPDEYLFLILLIIYNIIKKKLINYKKFNYKFIIY